MTVIKFNIHGKIIYQRNVSLRKRKRTKIYSPSIVHRPDLINNQRWTSREVSELWVTTFGIGRQNVHHFKLNEEEVYPLTDRTTKAINDKLNAELKKESLFGSSWKQVKHYWKNGIYDWKQIRQQLTLELRNVRLLGKMEDEYYCRFPSTLIQLQQLSQDVSIPDC